MDKKILEIQKKLNQTKGLHDCFILDEDDREIILQLEEKNNIGVQECVKRKYTLVVVHDSSFREPEGKIVKKKKSSVEFPAVPFSEVKAKNVVSSSPSRRVHSFLVERFHLHPSQEDATLLIGFDV